MCSNPLSLWQEDRPASPSASLEHMRGSRKTILGGSGLRSSMWFAEYDRDTSSWRTPQASLFSDSTTYSESWPASGSMRNGRCYQHAPWVRHTHESACSSWPTPRASDWNGQGSPHTRDRHSWQVKDAVRAWEGIGPLNPDLTGWLMGFPTGWSVCKATETP